MSPLMQHEIGSLLLENLHRTQGTKFKLKFGKSHHVQHTGSAWQQEAPGEQRILGVRDQARAQEEQVLRPQGGGNGARRQKSP